MIYDLSHRTSNELGIAGQSCIKKFKKTIVIINIIIIMNLMNRWMKYEHFGFLKGADS